jgi:mono/diheme cytochrome c family protein
MQARDFVRHVLTGVLVMGTVTAIPAYTAEKIDIKAGQMLHDKHCVACHVQRWGGDGSAVYTRPDRLIKSPDALRQRVAACNAQTDARLFPEDEANVAAYLAQRFYRFK